MTEKFDITKHHLVPKHIRLSEKEKEELLQSYNIIIENLPQILAKDPAIAHLKLKEGDIIKIMRNNPNVGEVTFYRCVVNG